MEYKDFDESCIVEDAIRKGCTSLLLLLSSIALAAVLLLLTSCRTKYVPVESVKTEYRHTTDTVRQLDSIIREKETVVREADSAMLAALGMKLKDGERAIVVLQKELERVRNQEREVRCDTVIEKDTIRVPYPVEGKVKAWEKVKLGCMGVLGGMVAMAVVMAVAWVGRKKEDEK